MIAALNEKTLPMVARDSAAALAIATVALPSLTICLDPCLEQKRSKQHELEE